MRRSPTEFHRLFEFRAKVTNRTELLMGILAFISFILIWHITASSGWIRPEFLPTPLSVVEAFFRLFPQRDFEVDIGISVGRVWLAFFLSVVVAVPLGILMSTYRAVGSLCEPVVDLIRYLPVPALVPLLIIWFGIGEVSKIAVLWMGTFFQLVLLIADDAKRVPEEYIESAFTLGAKPRQVIGHILVPSMLPSMIDNFRITLGWCWTYLIIAEIVAASSGIGHLIWSMRRFVKTPEVMAGIITIGIIGLITDQVIRWLHRRSFRYLQKS